MTEVTVRFRAQGTIPYAQALVELTEFAHGSEADFEFGPVTSVHALVNNGLAVTGDEAVVSVISDLLGEKVPGLYAAEA